MDDRFYSAAICRRGHIVDSMLGSHPRGYSSPPAPNKCATCGAQVLTACPSCGSRLRGHLRGVVHPDTTLYDFCDSCGAALPWASRQARLWELENRLEESTCLSEADRLMLHEQMVALQQPDLSDEEQIERWSRIKRVAPGLLDVGRAIFVSVTSAYVQQKLGV